MVEKSNKENKPNKLSKNFTMNNIYKLLTLYMFFSAISLFGQEKKIIYFKNSEVVTEKQNWDLKIIIQKSFKNEKDIISMETFNKNNVLINKEITEATSDKKNMKNYTEKIFPEYDAKTISEANFKNGVSSSVSKCVTMNGKVIFPDRACEEEGKSLDGKFQVWLAEQIKNLFRDEEKPLKYLVRFDVTPDYKIVVKKINHKEITADLNSLDSNEIKILATIKNSPIKYFEGVLRKIAGKDAKTAFNIPVHWMGSSY